jgi:CubicO group peptidase (beta-lactamase class C family)
VLLVRNDKLVVEEYFPGTHPVIGETLEQEPDWEGRYQAFDRDTLHTLQSATKSVNSILVGIAIDQKLIPGGVDEPIRTFFPGMTSHADIRLKHFLSMTAGLDWNETVPFTDPANDCDRMNHSDDPVAMLLRRQNVAPPGSTFVYNSAASVTLGEIVRKASGMPVDRFAQTHLFTPMGISNYAWRGRFRNGVIHTGGGLYLRPRDMAKIGCMMLNNGRWRGKQIVSEQWVRESLKQQTPDRGYGYQWWMRTFKVGDRTVVSSWAGGYGGQFIFLFPDLHLVVVTTGWNPENGGQFMGMMERYILPAARAD